MNNVDKQYIDLVKNILEKGEPHADRTGVGTLSLFGTSLRFDLSKGFPILTTKKVFYRQAFHETLWMFIQGSSDCTYLKDNNTTIWSEWTCYFGDYFDNTRKRGWVKNKPLQKFQDYDVLRGFPIAGVSKEDVPLAKLWTSMMKRCYLKSAHNYRFYGAKGIFVDKRWHCVKTFIKDVKQLPNWKLKKNNWNLYELDKDYYNSNCYSKDNCVWLHTAENNLYIDDPIEITDSEGNSEIYLSFNEAEKYTNIPSSTLNRWVSKGISEKCDLKYRKYVGYFFKKIKKEGYSFRILFHATIGNLYGTVLRAYRINREDPNNTIDQLQRCIDMIKTNPNSRRIVMTAFDPRFVADEKLSFLENVEAGNGVLNPCHSNFIQFKVVNGKLSGYFLTRSNDVCLGAPFNYIQAALLIHMVAHVCDLEVGEVIYNVADTHIYTNHIDVLKEQITREPYPLPKLIIKRKVTDINDFKFEDFELQDYNSHPILKADVAI